jgi:hypothetical protein
MGIASKAPVPSDPEGQNDTRAARAALAVTSFLTTDRLDPRDAVQDLLCDLAHYCDRNGEDFAMALRSAKTNYKAETDGIRSGVQFDSIAIHL